jgi:hypothetical protein
MLATKTVDAMDMAVPETRVRGRPQAFARRDVRHAFREIKRAGLPLFAVEPAVQPI